MTTQLSQDEWSLDEFLRLPISRQLNELAGAADADASVGAVIDAVEGLVLRDLTQGLEAGARIVTLADRVAGPSTRCKARRVCAHALAYANRFDEALGVLETATGIATAGGDSVEAARARMTSLHALARLGRFAEARAVGAEARAAFADAGETLLAAKTDLNLGSMKRLDDDPHGALAHYARALPAFENEPILRAQLLSNRAEALLDLHRFADAEDAFRSALAGFEEAGLHRAAAMVVGNLGDLTSQQGRLEEAMTFYERARRVLEREEASVELARVRCELAEVLVALGLREEASGHYEDVLPVLREHGMATEAARALAGYARLHLLDGNEAAAAALLPEAADAFAALGGGTGLARVRIVAAELQRRRGDRGAARAHLEDALAALAERPLDSALVEWRLAALAEDDGDPARARQLLDAALDRARRLGVRPLVGDLLVARARVAGRRADRLADLREAVDVVENMLVRLPGDALRTALLADRMDAYAELINALAGDGNGATDPGAVAEIFELIERAKGRAVFEHIESVMHAAGSPAPTAPTASPDAELAAEIARLRAELSALYGRMLDVVHASEDDARSAMIDRERRLAGLEQRLAVAQGPQGLMAPPARLADVQAILDPETALIEYDEIGTDVIAVIVRHDGARLFRVADAATVRAAVGAFGFQLRRARAWSVADPDSTARLAGDAVRVGRALHDLLLAPCTDALAGVRRLMVVPRGDLHGVPFTALHDGSGYLVERYCIQHAPTATILTHLLKREMRAPAATPLVVSVADADAPEIDAEVDAIAATLPDVRRLEGDAATVAQFQRAAAGASVIHVACHGRFSADTPMASGLRLADRWLTIREIQDLPCDGAVIVLSGCETGMAARGRAEELVGLVRSFLAAGAITVVASRWSVDDTSTRIVMAAAYARWHNQGKARSAAAQPPVRTWGFAEALTEAQRELMQQHPHPAWWAPFVVVGGA